MSQRDLGFAEDPSDVGLVEHWFSKSQLSDVIQVPFPAGSAASGVASVESDFVWYQRSFELPHAWQGSQVRLNFGACDHHTRVFVNGLEVGQNRGGYAPFSFDISYALQPGENQLVVRVSDSLSWSQPRGKQEGTTRWPIDYDGIIGIWQSVWLEPVEPVFIKDLASSFDLSTSTFSVTAGLSELSSGDVSVALLVEGKVVATMSETFEGREEVRLSLPVKDAHLWSPERPFLYDVKIDLKDTQGTVVDEVHSYAGLRSFEAREGEVLLNGEPIYLRGVLDQGYFPGGWYAAEHDEDFKRDIELTKALGFNLARKHQKAEDPRYLYWADKLGLLVWAEMPSGRIFAGDLIQSLTNEWLDLVRRDRAHPCVMAWVPFNESWGVWNQKDRPEQRAFVDGVVGLTRALDQSRFVVGNDGWEFSSGDLWTLHLYEGDGTPLGARLERVLADPEALLFEHGRVGALPGSDVSGLPVLLTECGGVGFLPEGYEGATFAYGELPDTLEEFERRCRGVAKDVSSAKPLVGYVWTQLTDIQQEINGVLSFERKPKLPLEVFREIFEGIG